MSDREPGRTLIVGCGDIGRRAARRLLAEGRDVAGFVRSPGSADALDRLGVRPVTGDLDYPPLPELPSLGADLFHFAPPPRSGEVDSRTGNLIAALERDGNPRRIVYISTTGVYGDCGGAWIDEHWPPNPSVARAKRRLDAEYRLRAWRERSGGELVILRVGGIYGPGRLPLERLQKGLPLVREEEAPFTNRIHADDLVAVALAAMERGRDGAVYNATDGQPSTMTDYFNRIADLVGLPRPPLIPLAEASEQLSVGMASYMAESRRLDNRKLREELGVTLCYPSLDQGLSSCLEPPVA